MDLIINGTTHTFQAESDMPLLWVLRDILNLTGTKYGCGKGLCGSCSVLIDGESVRTCTLPVSNVLDRKIITIEGIKNEFEDLQKTWNNINVPQCGFCQPGQIISAAALLKKNSNPSEEEIDDAMSGNLCRCGTYTRIKKAIQITAKIMNNED